MMCILGRPGKESSQKNHHHHQNPPLLQSLQLRQVLLLQPEQLQNLLLLVRLLLLRLFPQPESPVPLHLRPQNLPQLLVRHRLLYPLGSPKLRIQRYLLLLLLSQLTPRTNRSLKGFYTEYSVSSYRLGVTDARRNALNKRRAMGSCL